MGAGVNGTQIPVVGGDARVAAVVKTILEDEGLAVARLTPASPAVLRDAVAHLEPASILLHGAGRGDSGQSWRDAAGLRRRARPIPVIMFPFSASADARATYEARLGTSRRSQDAAVAAVLLEKPFDLDELVALVVGVLGHDDGPVPGSVGTDEVGDGRAHDEHCPAGRRVAAGGVGGARAGSAIAPVPAADPRR